MLLEQEEELVQPFLERSVSWSLGNVWSDTDRMPAYFEPSSEGREHRAERLAKDLSLGHGNANGHGHINGNGPVNGTGLTGQNDQKQAHQ